MIEIFNRVAIPCVPAALQVHAPLVIGEMGSIALLSELIIEKIVLKICNGQGITPQNDYFWEKDSLNVLYLLATLVLTMIAPMVAATLTYVKTGVVSDYQHMRVL